MMKPLLVTLSVTLAASAAFAQQAPAGRGRAAAPSVPAALAPPVQVPFPAGAKIAYVNLQYIAANSADGRAANTKVNALVQKKQAEAAANQKTQQDAQRFQQAAQEEIQKLQADLQNEFQKKLFPILQAMAQEKHLSMLLSA